MRLAHRAFVGDRLLHEFGLRRIGRDLERERHAARMLIDRGIVPDVRLVDVLVLPRLDLVGSSRPRFPAFSS